MSDDSMSNGVEHKLHVARAKYLTAYMLLSHATAQLERLAITRGAYKRTRRSIVRAAAMVLLVGGLLGMPSTSDATPVFAPPVDASTFGLLGCVYGPQCSPAFADIDGDGDLDAFVGGFGFASGTKYSGPLFFENYGTPSVPSFGGANQTAFGLYGTTSGGVPSIAADFHGNPVLVDIDGDNDLDYFDQDTPSSTRFFENVGTVNAPAFVAGSLPSGLGGSGYGDAQAFVDIDGDSDLDLFSGIGGAYAEIDFQQNTGTPLVASFAAPVSDPFGLSAPDNHPSPAFVDADGDGDLDLFMGKYDGTLRYQNNNGTPNAPSFGTSIGSPFGFTYTGAGASKPAFADIDDDGDQDLFLGTNLGSVLLYENTEINCGDGIVNAGEVCDAANLDGETCETQGLDSGTLTCAPDCQSFDLTACPGQACAPTPSGTCLVPGQSQLQVKNDGDPTKQQIKWKWKKGAAFAQGVLGSPATTTDHALCIYDRTAGVPALVGRVSVQGSALWVDKNPKGFQYIDKTGAQDGTTKVQLKTGDPGKTSASLQAKGVNLTLPPPISGSEYFDQDTAVTVQLVSEAGVCWSSDFTTAGTTKNDGVQFKAK